MLNKTFRTTLSKARSALNPVGIRPYVRAVKKTRLDRQIAEMAAELCGVVVSPFFGGQHGVALLAEVLDCDTVAVAVRPMPPLCLILRLRAWTVSVLRRSFAISSTTAHHSTPRLSVGGVDCSCRAARSRPGACRSRPQWRRFADLKILNASSCIEQLRYPMRSFASSGPCLVRLSRIAKLRQNRRVSTASGLFWEVRRSISTQPAQPILKLTFLGL